MKIHMAAKTDPFKHPLFASVQRRFFAKAKQEEGELYIYDAIGADYWGGVSAQQVADTLRDLKSNGVKTLNIYINSPGGDVFEAMAIVNNIRRFGGAVNVMVDGLAASAATLIMMAADKGCLKVASNSMVMVHNPWGFAIGEAKDMREYADMLDKVRGQISDMYVARTGKTKDEVHKLMDEETWMTGDECKTAGFCDECIKEESVVEPANNAVQHPILATYKKTPEKLKQRATSASTRLAHMEIRAQQLKSRASPAK